MQNKNISAEEKMKLMIFVSVLHDSSRLKLSKAFQMISMNRERFSGFKSN
jgi:hypothetical protein